jgi:hypothetical protein
MNETLIAELRARINAYRRNEEAIFAYFGDTEEDLLTRAADALEQADNAIERQAAVMEKDFAKALRLMRAGPEGANAFSFYLQSEFMPIIANLLGASFVDNGGVNFVEMGVNSDATGPLVLTMQRAEGKTPAELLADVRRKYEAEVAALRAAMKE